MIILQSTDKVEVTVSGAIATNQLACLASYRDLNNNALVAPGRNAIVTNGTTPVDLVGSPASGNQRIIDWLNIYNSDTTSHTVTVQIDVSGTNYIIENAILGQGEKIEFQEGQGFSVYANNGAKKNLTSGGTSPISTSRSQIVLSADVTNNNAVANTIQDVTGLEFAVTAGSTYYIKSAIWFTAAATTTGARFMLGGTASGNIIYNSQMASGATANTFINANAFDTGTVATSSNATGGNLAVIEGFFVCTVDGLIRVRFASEIAGSAIVAKRGSFVEYQVTI